MALWNAVKSRPDSRQQPAVIFHSDRGSKYASKSFRHMLSRFRDAAEYDSQRELLG